ncbi:MAG: hypothetical protein JXA21_10410 [Anaerolineae bacterium]|nr:hypothetical protein [Anaerolineae bacterium]
MNEFQALQQRAQRAAALGGVVAVKGATLLKLIDHSTVPGALPDDALWLAYNALLATMEPQAILRHLQAGRVLLLSHATLEKITVALDKLRVYLGKE